VNTFRNLIVRGNALFLMLASTGGLVTDIAASFFGRGAEATLIAGSPGASVGFIEAHGLALIIGVAAWSTAYVRQWHFGLAAVHVLLGTVNLLFWQVFVATDLLAVGYATTTLHFAFVAAHLVALAVPSNATAHPAADACGLR